MTNGIMAAAASLTAAQRRAVLEQIRAEWLATRYQLEIALRVDQRLHRGAEIEAQRAQGIAECDVALDELARIAAALGE